MHLKPDYSYDLIGIYGNRQGTFLCLGYISPWKVRLSYWEGEVGVFGVILSSFLHLILVS